MCETISDRVKRIMYEHNVEREHALQVAKMEVNLENELARRAKKEKN